MVRRRIKDPVTQRNAGPITIRGGQFPLGSGAALEYVQGARRLVFGDQAFIVLLYGAMNVYGLIGSECNGIGVLWENRREVVILEHFRDSSYLSASKKQRDEYARVCALDAAAFEEFVNSHPKAGCKIEITDEEE